MIAIIVIGTNNLSFLPDCFRSISRSDYRNYTIIYVDNGSTDGSVEYVKNNFPDTMIIENKANLGFPEANNVGIRKAIKLGARYVMILNPDTLVDSRCLSSLMAKANDKTILQPLILLHDGHKTNLVNTGGNILHILGFSYCGDYRLDARLIKEKSIALSSGAAALIPMAIIKKVGLFDDTFFLYHEDVDLFWRSRMYGFDIVLEPKALIWHKYSYSRNLNKMYYVERNRLAFITKNFQLRTILLLLPLGFMTELAMLVYSLKEGWFSKKAASYFGYIKMVPILLRKREKIQKNRKKSDRELLTNYGSSVLNFSEVTIPAARYLNNLIDAYWHFIRKAL